MKPSGVGSSISSIDVHHQSSPAVVKSNTKLSGIRPAQLPPSKNHGTQYPDLREVVDSSLLDDFLIDAFDAEEPTTDELAHMNKALKELRINNRWAMLTDSEARQFVRQISNDFERSNSSLPPVPQQSQSSSSSSSPINSNLRPLEKKVSDLTKKLEKAKNFSQKKNDEYVNKFVSVDDSQKARGIKWVMQALDKRMISRALDKADTLVSQTEKSLEEAQKRLEQAQAQLR